jgi:hypothetical protein
VVDLYLSRDLFYLAVCCLGFGAGCGMYLFTSGLTLKQRNQMVSVAILWVSGMLVFLCLAIVFSKGEVFFYRGFLITGGIIFILMVLSYRFPKYVGFPLTIIAGFLIVTFAFLFLRFPLANEIDPLVVRTDVSNQASVRILRSSDSESPSESADFELVDLDNPLAINMYEFYIDETFPFVGGQVRSSPSEIVQNGTVIFTNPMISRIPFVDFLKDKNKRFIIKIKESQRDISIEDLS